MHRKNYDKPRETFQSEGFGEVWIYNENENKHIEQNYNIIHTAMI